MKNLKYILVFIYLILIIFFSVKSGQILEINSFSEISIENIQEKLDKIKQNNYYLLIFYYFIFSLIWSFFLGFISPILLIAGYILSPIHGAVIVSLANAISGSILIFIIRKYFIKYFKKYFGLKINKIIKFIDKDVNTYFFIFRLVGGFGTPSQIQNLIPSLTKIKILNYIILSLFGCLPIFYISTTIGYSFNFITEIESINSNIFSNVKFLTIISSVILILILIKFIKKRIKI
tara:strand:- start:77 stop:778 length:702 start_codon:yes stop_codon:yes gene_type:complete